MSNPNISRISTRLVQARGIIAFLGREDIDEKDRHLIYTPSSGDLANVAECLMDLLDGAVEDLGALESEVVG